jgi:hypothetical protein
MNSDARLVSGAPARDQMPTDVWTGSLCWLNVVTRIFNMP